MSNNNNTIVNTIARLTGDTYRFRGILKEYGWKWCSIYECWEKEADWMSAEEVERVVRSYPGIRNRGSFSVEFVDADVPGKPAEPGKTLEEVVAQAVDAEAMANLTEVIEISATEAEEAESVEIKSCPRCGIEGAVAELFGYRTMKRSKKDGTIVTTVRAQSFCKPCRRKKPVTVAENAEVAPIVEPAPELAPERNATDGQLVLTSFELTPVAQDLGASAPDDFARVVGAQIQAERDGTAKPPIAAKKAKELFENKTVKELRALCAEHLLNVDGRKAELVARLTGVEVK